MPKPVSDAEVFVIVGTTMLFVFLTTVGAITTIFWMIE
jgi:hypothetical protein